MLIANAKVLEETDVINTDKDDTLYAVPFTPSPVVSVTPNHVATLQNLITQVQTSDKALYLLEKNLGHKKIPSTLLSLILSSECRKKLLDHDEAHRFLSANPCLLRFLETIRDKPGLLTTRDNVLASLSELMGQNSNQQQQQPQGTPRPPRQGLITPEMFQQALNGALQRTGLASSSSSTSTSDSTSTSQHSTPLPPPQPMNGVQEGMAHIQQQVGQRAEQLAQLHAMGLTNDLQNIQALAATNGNVEAAIELLFSEYN